MKSLVLIDGENFIHALAHILTRQKLISSRQKLRRIDISTLLDFTDPPSGIFYYSTRINLPNEKSTLTKKVEKMRHWNSFWIPYLANQNVKIIKAGILKVRDGKKCQKCGHKTEVLIEKGVDVRLGVDIVSLGGKNTQLYVISSDSDLIPAINVARKAGTQITYVTFEGNINHALSKCSSAMIVLSKKKVKESFNRVNNG